MNIEFDILIETQYQFQFVYMTLKKPFEIWMYTKNKAYKIQLHKQKKKVSTNKGLVLN